MGAGNSPALAGRYGLAFVRLLLDKGPHLFGTRATTNTWWKAFSTGMYNPTLGHGYVLLLDDGTPANRIWVHVDDFAIHGPTYEATTAALSFFMDQAVIVGLLCNPHKCTPPAQVTKYCGFLFDTRGPPVLRIPKAKRERALAMIRYCLSKGITHRHSRWGLAVIVGTLESLTDATPRRYGHTRLRNFHSLLRPSGLGNGLEPYCTWVSLSEAVLRDLTWWETFLLTDEGNSSRPSRPHVLVPMWGDGSGTGTGGTLETPTLQLQMWMGQWRPQVLHYSSNWKELKTLCLALAHLRTIAHTESLVGSQLFYFTDNMTTYWIA